jgi:hypothetical protein
VKSIQEGSSERRVIRGGAKETAIDKGNGESDVVAGVVNRGTTFQRGSYPRLGASSEGTVRRA